MNDKSETYINGWFANKHGISVESNPYNEFAQSASHAQWLSGWCDRFSARKHDLDMSLDEIIL